MKINANFLKYRSHFERMVRPAGIEQGSIILVHCGFIYFLDYFVSSFVSLFFKVLILAVFSLNLFKDRTLSGLNSQLI